MEKPKILTALPDVMGKTFEFELTWQPKLLGELGQVDYFWMAPHTYRGRMAGRNFRPCVEFYWKAMEAEGAQDEYAKANLVFAELYPYICRARTLQKIYLHAYLKFDHWNSYELTSKKGAKLFDITWKQELSVEEIERLRRIAATHDTLQVQKALDNLLLIAKPISFDRHEKQKEVAGVWIRDGIAAFEEDGFDGLRRYANSFGDLYAKCRKRGGVPEVHEFLNRFQYECMVAFNLCYANAWIGIIRWLREHRDLSAYGERLLRTWHGQGQPVEAVDGVPGSSRDPFMGQVLALHPLSLSALNKPEHLAAIARWVSRQDFEDLVDGGREAEASEYWEMVATILVAAAEYKASHSQMLNTQGAKEKSRESVYAPEAEVAANEAHYHLPEIFEGYAEKMKLRCKHCGERLKYSSLEGNSEDGSAIVQYRCSACGNGLPVSIRQKDLEEFLGDRP